MSNSNTGYPDSNRLVIDIAPPPKPCSDNGRKPTPPVNVMPPLKKPKK